MNILADASLPGLNEAFPEPFNLTCYNTPDELNNLLHNQDILLCRSTLKVNSSLLKNHPLQFVATASSGTDHLDHNYLKSRNISVIDAKGCNAVSVADYVLSCLAWLKKSHLFEIKKAGIIGMGHVGTEVFNRLKALDFQIATYDPLKEKQENYFKSCEPGALFECDLLCIHAELHDNYPYQSRNLINQKFLEQLKPGCIIINASRGGIVDEAAILKTRQSIIYCTDVYLNEPAIDKHIIDLARICTPHIAGHSLEAKYAAVALVSEQLHRIAKLPVPQFARPVLSQTHIFHKNESWEDQVLAIYNPVDETIQFKQAQDIESVFPQLRKKHHRHDFKTCFSAISDEKCGSLFGC